MDKAKLNEVAKTYLGTPHVNGGNIKGAGLDCCTLPTKIFEELGHKEFEILFGYSGDWFCKKDCKEILLPYLEKYCDKVDELQPGDIISYAWARARYAHLAVYLGEAKVVHCLAMRGVEITDITDPYFFGAKGKSRVTGYWRLKK